MQEGHLSSPHHPRRLGLEIRHILAAITLSSDLKYFPFTFSAISPRRSSTLNLSLILVLINPAQGHDKAVRTLPQCFCPPPFPVTAFSSSSHWHRRVDSLLPSCRSLFTTSQPLHAHTNDRCRSIPGNECEIRPTHSSSREPPQWQTIAIIAWHWWTDWRQVLGVFFHVYLERQQISPYSHCHWLHFLLYWICYVKGIYCLSVKPMDTRRTSQDLHPPGWTWRSCVLADRIGEN